MAGTRDITLDVTIRARTADAAKAEAALKRIDEQAKHAGKSMEGMTGDAHILNAEIKKSEQTIHELDKALLEFGNDKGVRSRLRQERSWLAELKKLEKDMSGAGKQVAAVSDNFGKQLGQSFGGIQPTGPLIAMLVGAAVAAAPTVGAMLGGAVAGTAGTAAMAAGILSAVHDQRVQDAAKRAGSTIADEFFGGGQAFVVPVLDAIDILEKAIGDLHFGDALAKMAPTVTVIAQGLGAMLNNLMPGLNKALDRMGPFADVAANGLADMGSAFGQFLDDVTASKGSLEGLASLFGLVNGSVRLLGGTIHWLSDAYREEIKVSRILLAELEGVAIARGNTDLAAYLHGLGVNIDEMVNSLNKAPSAINGVNQELDPFGGYLQHAWQEMERLKAETDATNKSLTDYFHMLMSNDQAQLDFNKGLLDFKETLKENGRHWEDNTKAGIANREGLLGLIEKAERARETEIALGGDTGEANKKFYDQVEALLEVARKAGATKELLDKLRGEYIISLVLTGAIDKGAQKILNTIQNFFGGGFGGTGAPSGSGLAVQLTGRPAHESFAAGGVTPAFAPFRVHDGEMLWSNRQHYVSTAAQTKALASGGGSGSQVVEFRVTGAADSAVAALLHKLQRTGALQIFSSAVVTR